VRRARRDRGLDFLAQSYPQGFTLCFAHCDDSMFGRVQALKGRQSGGLTEAARFDDDRHHFEPLSFGAGEQRGKLNLSDEFRPKKIGRHEQNRHPRRNHGLGDFLSPARARTESSVLPDIKQPGALQRLQMRLDSRQPFGIAVAIADENPTTACARVTHVVVFSAR
jgi:hypothetical protein